MRSVLDLGGSEKLLTILSDGPVRGLRNWPAARAEILAGNVDALPVRETGAEPGEEHYYVYSLSPRGRRCLAGHRGVFA